MTKRRSKQEHAMPAFKAAPKEYMKNTDPDAYLDMPVKENPSIHSEAVLRRKGEFKLCPTCLGHGGWHLHLDSYGPGKHFNAGCSDCTGWGWIKAEMTELPTAKFERVKALFQDKIVAADGVYNTVGRRGGTYRLTDPALREHNDLHYALMLAADGWLPHNFGGGVQPLGNDLFSVTVYID